MLGIVLISLLLAACGNSGGGAGAPPSNANSAPKNGKGCTKVGVLLPETASSPRWETYDKTYLEKFISAIPGITVDYYNAQGDPNVQRNQADQAVTKGDCILVVAPKDAAGAAAIVNKVKPLGIPVIAYDRLIQSKDLNYYVSFDGVAVGKLQGQYIVDHYKDFVKGNDKNLSMINGSSDDNNAHLFNQGAEETLKPLIDGGSLKKVYDQFTPAWDPNTARNEMDQVLTAQQNNIQVAYVANDTMANSVISALRAKQLNGKVLVTGQDATTTGIQNILKGDQAMTVFKSYSDEAKGTADLVKALHDGTDPSSMTNGKTTQTSDGGSVPSILLTPVAVDKANLKQEIIDSGYLTKDVVCQGLPAGTGGVC